MGAERTHFANERRARTDNNAIHEGQPRHSQNGHGTTHPVRLFLATACEANRGLSHRFAVMYLFIYLFICLFV